MAEREDDEWIPLFDGRENPDEAVVRNIQAKLTTNLPAVAPIAGSRTFALLFMAAMVVISALSLLVLRAYGWDNMDLLRRTAVFFSLSVSLFVLAFFLAHQMVPGSRVYLSPLLLLSAVGLALLLVFACCFQIQAEQRFFASGLVCLEIGTPFAIPIVLLLFWTTRQGIILCEGSAFATIGVLAGLVSVTVLELHCPNFDLLHILTWHLGIPFAGAVLGISWAKLWASRQSA